MTLPGALLLPAILGVMSAGRSQSVGAFIAWQGLHPRAASPIGRGVTALAVAGEVIGDKTPWVPDRTNPGPLFGRTVIGAIGGAVLAHHRGTPILPAALAGAGAAAAGTFALHRARRWLGRHTPLPDLAWALVEDAGVAALGVAAARRLHRHEIEG